MRLAVQKAVALSIACFVHCTGSAWANEEATQTTARVALVTPEAFGAVTAGKREFLVQTDGEILSKGRVQIDDVPGLRSGDVGDVVWVVTNSSISGRLMRNGNVTGSFDGNVGRDGSASGIFRTTDGSELKWSWVPTTAE
jgi:hypothetical protein